MNIIEQLQQFGLSENEARVYSACLSLGGDSVQHIAQEAKLNRVTAYGIIEGLMQRGFLREEVNGNPPSPGLRRTKKKKIAAYPPMKLYDVLSREFDQLKRREKQLDTLIPELKQLSPVETRKTNVIYYEGEEGLKNWASDALETKGELLEWTKIESFSDRFDTYLHSFYYPEKFKRQIPTRFIFLDTPHAHEYFDRRYVENKKAPPAKARFIPQDLFDTPGFMVIYNDRYSIALPSEMRAVTVVDQTIADAQRKMWEFAWAHASGEVGNKEYPFDK
jgi:hypothetical protein